MHFALLCQVQNQKHRSARVPDRFGPGTRTAGPPATTSTFGCLASSKSTPLEETVGCFQVQVRAGNLLIFSLRSDTSWHGPHCSIYEFTPLTTRSQPEPWDSEKCCWWIASTWAIYRYRPLLGYAPTSRDTVNVSGT